MLYPCATWFLPFWQKIRKIMTSKFIAKTFWNTLGYQCTWNRQLSYFHIYRQVVVEGSKTGCVRLLWSCNTLPVQGYGSWKMARCPRSHFHPDGESWLSFCHEAAWLKNWKRSKEKLLEILLLFLDFSIACSIHFQVVNVLKLWFFIQNTFII